MGRYSLNIHSTFKSKLRGWIKDRVAADYNWNGWYTQILKQRHKSTLKFQGTINNVLYTVNDQVIPGGASTQTITHTHVPSRGEYVIKYILKPVSSSHAFTSLGRAVTTADWSNFDLSSNGGTDVNIGNFSLVLSTRKITNDTATFSFSVRVDERGTDDTTMAMAINNLVSCS